MSARLLEHINIRTTRLQETVRFYVEVLGLQRGDYPGKTVPGAWIYDAQGVPVVHIVATLPRPLSSLNGTGVIDHVAFAAVDYDAFVHRIKGLNLPYRTRDAMAGLRQIYVIDPNDVLIELNFRDSVEKDA
jgi:catechol 2,3-dioxygenase-like lactoylglutathione lyase family enzyme